LAAEVAALDGIRTALAIGAWSDADLQLSRYRQNFPDGALRSEAEVLALEALVAQGRKQAAAVAAERFIAQHPRDPQVARVRAFTQ
jgi:outer membrane protein assembly factor BamD (BamD/ComL family)